jgi:hypothetical protein
MPATLTADTETELHRKQRETARIYLWLVQRLGRREPKWVREIKAEHPKTWWQDSRFFTKLYRLVKKGETEVKIRNDRDRMIARELNFWMAAHHP